MLKLDAKFHIIPMDDFQVVGDENLWDVRMYPRGTSNDALKQIIICYRLTIVCCFRNFASSFSMMSCAVCATFVMVTHQLPVYRTFDFEF
jgi:hypothetical protein